MAANGPGFQTWKTVGAKGEKGGHVVDLEVAGEEHVVQVYMCLFV